MFINDASCGNQNIMRIHLKTLFTTHKYVNFLFVWNFYNFIYFVYKNPRVTQFYLIFFSSLFRAFFPGNGSRDTVFFC